MATKPAEPDFFSGDFYSVEEFDPSDPLTPEEFEDVPYFYTWELERALTIPNGQNERLKFDFAERKLTYERYFSGFLYPDASFLGKIKFTQDAHAQDQNVKGHYLKISEDHLILRGFLTDHTGGKEFFWIKLIR